MSSADNEFKAMQAVHDALAPLDHEARNRILNYIISLLEIDTRGVGKREDTTQSGNVSYDNRNSEESIEGQNTDYTSFAELYAAASPKTNGEKALVAGYWLQICEESDSFTGSGANKELTNLGHKLSNVTDAINSMKKRKPMLILQVKKSGSSKQARKTYKVSDEGVKRVKEMISG